MSGTNIVQHYRTETVNKAPAANTLLPGQLALELADPMKLWAGCTTTLDPTGRKLLYDKAAIAAAVVSHDATMTGDGNTVPLSVVQATQAQRGAAEVATAAEIAAAVPVDTFFISPLGLRSENGLPASGLTTNAKQIVPAINEMISDLAAVLGVLVFAGAYDAAASTGTYNGHGGIAAGTGPLPAAAVGNDNAFVIVYTNGPGSVGNEPAEALHMEDWLVSDGTAWIALHLHQTTILASNVGVVPAVNGWTNVQQALEGIWSVASTALQAIFLTTPTFSGDALTAATALEVNILDAGSYV